MYSTMHPRGKANHLPGTWCQMSDLIRKTLENRTAAMQLEFLGCEIQQRCLVDGPWYRSRSRPSVNLADSDRLTTRLSARLRRRKVDHQESPDDDHVDVTYTMEEGERCAVLVFRASEVVKQFKKPPAEKAPVHAADGGDRRRGLQAESNI
ncbi:hypothetical protein BJV78DRAFT_1157427 [Lactifluus subvellereus]|nr:hypothetical protein BJV78DRAFT_1157427 [Lactifluus subvellereus]